MPTPKPGQIRCPTCQQPTPAAAYCTQCGAPLPSSLQARPRGMDRAELEERVRHRRPGDPATRRGRSAGDDVPPSGYVPFQPEPEDASAVRDDIADEQAAHVDNTPPGFDEPLPPLPPAYRAPRDDHSAAAVAGYAAASADEPPPAHEPDAFKPEPYGPPPAAATYGEAPIDEPPHGPPEDAYPYASPADDGGGRGGSSALPIIGFILLGLLALGVGAVLATLLGGGDGVGQASPTQTPVISIAPSEVPSTVPSASASGPPSSTPEPNDGPVTFPDGALITVQPCASSDMSFDGCLVDGSTITDPTMWVWIGFEDTGAADTITLTLESDGDTIDQQEKVLGEVLGQCSTNGQPVCSGYLIGAAYRGLEPGDYELVVRRNDDFADRATFRVEG